MYLPILPSTFNYLLLQVQDEQRARGSVKLAVYVSYFMATGGWAFLTLFTLGYIATALAELGRDLWVRVWTESVGTPSANGTTFDAFDMASHATNVVGSDQRLLAAYGLTSTVGFHFRNLMNRLYMFFPNYIQPKMGQMSNLADNKVEHGVSYYLGIYAALSILSLLIGIGAELIQLYGSLVASREMHKKMLDSILGAPVRFFERTPVGRVLNRFTKDLSTIDGECLNNISSVAHILLGIATTFLLIIYIAPVSIFVIPIIMFLYYWISMMYLNVSREIKRLESLSNSPIYAQFSETLMGVSTLRAYGAERRSRDLMEMKVDKNNIMSYYLLTCNRWLNLRCELLSTMFVTVVGVSVVGSGMSPGWAGLALSYTFDFTSNLTFYIRANASMDMSMNSVERVDEYSVLEQEPPAVIENSRPPPNWPSKGHITVENMSIRYAEDLPLVLKNLTFEIKPHEKIGVVGRTGAG
jgi:ABC-type multidrug transport system fused ATPase/permease subunit